MGTFICMTRPVRPDFPPNGTKFSSQVSCSILKITVNGVSTLYIIENNTGGRLGEHAPLNGEEV